MGPNAAIGAGFILLGCLTAQSEQIMDILGVRGVDGKDKAALGKEGEDNHDDDDHKDGAFPQSVLDEIEPTKRLELESAVPLSPFDDVSMPIDTIQNTPIAATLGEGIKSLKRVNGNQMPSSGARTVWAASSMGREKVE